MEEMSSLYFHYYTIDLEANIHDGPLRSRTMEGKQIKGKRTQ